MGAVDVPDPHPGTFVGRSSSGHRFCRGSTGVGAGGLNRRPPPVPATAGATENAKMAASAVRNPRIRAVLMIIFSGTRLRGYWCGHGPLSQRSAVTAAPSLRGNRIFQARRVWTRALPSIPKSPTEPRNGCSFARGSGSTSRGGSFVRSFFGWLTVLVIRLLVCAVGSVPRRKRASSRARS